MITARSKDISGPYPIVISPTSLVTLSPTFTPKSGQFDQQVLNLHIACAVLVHMVL